MRAPGDVVELDRDCELGNCHERAVVVSVDDRYTVAVFPYRNKVNDRAVRTGRDYLYLKDVP